jgi:hypothetical protein
MKLENKIVYYKETFECQHLIFWPVSQWRVHCHLSFKYEENVSSATGNFVYLMKSLLVSTTTGVTFTDFRLSGHNSIAYFCFSQTLNRHIHVHSRSEDHILVAFLPFVSTTFNRISRVLSKHNIKTIGLLLRNLSSFLQPLKDYLAQKTASPDSVEGCTSDR